MNVKRRDFLASSSVLAAAGLPLGRVQGADYVIFGPLFETSSKPGYGPAQGTGGLEALVAAAGMPVVGIGGITPENAPDVIAAGASGVAMMGAPLTDPGCLEGLALPTLSPIFNRRG